ncbi:MAG: hypothetical protein ACSHX6_09865 [Akkermansiaceae bacterium]
MTLAASDPPLYLIILIPTLMIGFWCFVCFILSFVGGWGRMAKRYPSNNLPTGDRFTSRSLKVGLTNYNRCLTIHANQEGIHLAIWLIFRPGHPPIFLPWSELKNQRPSSFLWINYLRVEVGSPKTTTLSIPEKDFKAFLSNRH